MPTKKIQKRGNAMDDISIKKQKKRGRPTGYSKLSSQKTKMITLKVTPECAAWHRANRGQAVALLEIAAMTLVFEPAQEAQS